MARDFPKKLDILPFFCYNGLIFPERSPAMPSPSILVTILRVLLFIAAPACLSIAGLLFWVQFTFSRRPKNTAKTAGILREANHKQNVTLHGTRGRSMFVKHLTKARYVYTIDGTEYPADPPRRGSARFVCGEAWISAPAAPNHSRARSKAGWAPFFVRFPEMPDGRTPCGKFPRHWGHRSE